MGFELHLLRAEGPMKAAELLDWARQVPGLECPAALGDVGDLRFRDPATGVHFHLRYRAEGFPTPDDAPPPAGLVSGGLVAALPGLRPGYFASQLKEVLADLCDRSGLLPAVSGAASLEPVALEELPARYRAWTREQVIASRAQLAGRGSLPLQLAQYLPEPDSDLWWRYRRAEAGLRAELGPAVMVPSILLLRPLESPRLVTAVSWPNGGPIALPPVDLVFLLRGVQGVRATDMAMVHTSALVRDLAPFLEEHHDFPGLRVLGQEAVFQVTPWFLEAESLPGPEDFEQVDPGVFTEVPLDPS